MFFAEKARVIYRDNNKKSFCSYALHVGNDIIPISTNVHLGIL
jgi:hypothetical protein